MLYPLSYGRMPRDLPSDCLRIAERPEAAEIIAADARVPPWIVPICATSQTE
jgi:hypothetical protein